MGDIVFSVLVVYAITAPPALAACFMYATNLFPVNHQTMTIRDAMSFGGILWPIMGLMIDAMVNGMNLGRPPSWWQLVEWSWSQTWGAI